MKKGPITLFFEYLPVYHEINKNPRAYRAMKKTPGYRWMRRGTWIFWFLLALSSVLGYLLD